MGTWNEMAQGKLNQAVRIRTEAAKAVIPAVSMKKLKREHSTSTSKKPAAKIHLWSESNITRAAFQYKQKQNKLKEDRKCIMSL